MRALSAPEAEMDEAILESAGHCFAASYGESRAKFRAAAGNVHTYASAGTGPDGRDLTTDVALVGRPSAERMLVFLSAIHGVEGYCGAAGQIDWLRQRGKHRLNSNEAVLLVHALNAYGFAWNRRVTEEGCDLNRNFVDFSRALPANTGYDELARYLVPHELEGPAFAAAEEAISRFRRERGEFAFQVARKSGQYSHPNGLCFGGTGPTSARLVLEKIAADFDLAGKEQVVVIDYHSGSGPFGYGELQCEQPSGMEGFQRARRLFGESVTSPDLGTSSSVPLHGSVDEYWQRILGDRHVYVALEFGTYDQERARRVLRQDHWLYSRPDIDKRGEFAQQVYRDSRAHWYPETDEWKEMILWRSRQVQRQALAGLRQ